MIVVADASPFVALVKIGHADVLPRMFGNVVIPPEVRDELQRTTQAQAVQRFAASAPAWLIVKEAPVVEYIPGLDAGERAAISLARSLPADVLLIDETLGRQAAMECGIPTVRTGAILRDAADVGVLDDLASAFARLKATNFRIPHHLLDAMLERHLTLKRKSQDEFGLR
ncbi:MAG TPA: hypothetical protein VF624_12225 [Tepidisphaeraceae bacterium]|jgi:predicted nucleic acid-binding protein